MTATNEDGQSKALLEKSIELGIPVLAKDLIAFWMICLMIKDLCILVILCVCVCRFGQNIFGYARIWADTPYARKAFPQNCLAKRVCLCGYLFTTGPVGQPHSASQYQTDP